MDLGELSQEKIHGALRSVFRYKEMTEGQAPGILVETEARLLEERFSLLSAKEIFELIKIWPEYLTHQSAIQAVDDQRFEDFIDGAN